ncbi:hypothetical protein BGX38DRAFT_1145651 [Terfezia claveryi]|nr:hypothetical protein BGX38DRAFT_1145651 [Terfezia claveryi]
MYLALFQDLIAVGGHNDKNIGYSYGYGNSQQPMNFDQASESTVKAQEQGKLPTRSRIYEGWELTEQQHLAHPITKVPLIFITPPDSIKHEPLNKTICKNPKYDGNDSGSISNEHKEIDPPNSRVCDTGKQENSESALGTDTREDIEEFSCSLYQHDVESLTKDYQDWLRLAQSVAREACGDDLASSASSRVGPSMATSRSCQELILWRPDPASASRNASTSRISVGRRFSLNQPIVYPFRNKRNSV